MDGAEFLIDQHFDISIELHQLGSEFPDISGLSVTINDRPMSLYFNSNFSMESWNFNYFEDSEARDNKTPTLVSVKRIALRSVSLKKAGSYTVCILIAFDAHLQRYRFKWEKNPSKHNGMFEKVQRERSRTWYSLSGMEWQ